jgi:CBS domain-containing protein
MCYSPATTQHQQKQHLRAPNKKKQKQKKPKSLDVVADVMSSGSLFTCSPEDTVDAALEQLVAHRVTGLPVVDPTSGALVGVVSDYDLLALDTLGRVSPASPDTSLFPAADQTWQAFKEVKTLLAKSSGKKVRDVMTASPITVNPGTDLDAAAALLLRKKIHRLPVVDEQSGKLVGVLSRGNLVKAALAIRKEAAAAK